MKKFWYFLILSAWLFCSCRKKDLPETVPATHSDFYFNGNVAGTAVSLRAGMDNYYMYSSHKRDDKDIYNFIADLRPAGCTSCGNALQITIHDFRRSLVNEATRIDSSLLPETYPILGVPFYAVQFRSQFNQQAASYLWNFGDNSTSRQANPLHIYKTAGNYSVSLTINSTGSCQQYISNIEKISYPAANAKISVVTSSVNSMSFHPSIADSLSYNYRWSFGDGFSSSSPDPSHTYAIPGTYPVLLRVINAQQDTLYARYNVATQTIPMPCLTNYSIESVAQVVNPLPLSTIIINWTDENGDVYTSNNVLQPATSYFKIISVENYDPNERGEKTKRIKVRFTCHVFNGTRVKVIDNGDALLAVSYK